MRCLARLVRRLRAALTVDLASGYSYEAIGADPWTEPHS